MKLNVANELKLPGREGHASLCKQTEDIEYFGRMIRFADNIAVEVSYVFDGSGFELRGSIKTAIKGECARCAKELIIPFEHDFIERFEKNSPEGDDNDAYLFSGEELDLSDLVRDNILLNMDNYVLCKDDCRGLCPVCGCDLNTVQCSCEQEANEENPFSKLKALFNDDKEV